MHSIKTASFDVLKSPTKEYFMHINELKCAIKDKVQNNTIKKSRYENYLKFVEKGEL